MDSSMKFFAISAVFLATAQVIFAVCPYAPQPTATYCTGAPPAATADWDVCNSIGTFKSKSYCYLGSRGYVTRYDWYTCTKSSSGAYVMTKYCCTNQPQTPYTNAKGDADIFNFYNPTSGKCDLVAPTEPPATTTPAGATTAAGASSAPTTAAPTTSS